MNLRMALIAALMVAIGALWKYLDGVLAVSGWTVWNGAEWGQVTNGWRLLVVAWPVALAGLLVGGLVLLLLVGYAYRFAHDADTRAELERAAQAAKAAEKRAQTAEQRAREALAAEWQRLRETQAAVELRRAEAEQMVANARQIASAATERAAIAERDMARLEKRSKNHKAAFTRLRAKVDRMEAEQGEGHG